MVPRLISRTETSARIALVAGGALLLPGDAVRIEIAVGPGATLDVEDVGGTVCYGEKGRGNWSEWEVLATVAAGGKLSWAGLPLVISDGARVHRRTRIVLAERATAVLRETSVLGRSGERGGVLRAEFRADLRVNESEMPLLVEDLGARGDRPEPGILGAHRVFDTVTALGFRPENAAHATVLSLDGPGATARFLGADAHRSPLGEVFSDWSVRGA